MNKDFNVYKWRRNQLLTESQIQGEWIDRVGEWKGKKYDGYFRTNTRGYMMPDEHLAVYGDDIKKMIEDKGYTFVGNDEVEIGSRTQRHMYYYTK
jgi:hypothetical protein